LLQDRFAGVSSLRTFALLFAPGRLAVSSHSESGVLNNGAKRHSTQFRFSDFMIKGISQNGKKLLSASHEIKSVRVRLPIEITTCMLFPPNPLPYCSLRTIPPIKDTLRLMSLVACCVQPCTRDTNLGCWTSLISASDVNFVYPCIRLDPWSDTLDVSARPPIRGRQYLSTLATWVRSMVRRCKFR